MISHFVEFNGEAVKSVKTGFRSAVRLARLSTESGKVTPHTLRHTAATWLMQRGADPWKAAGFLGMSVEVLLWPSPPGVPTRCGVGDHIETKAEQRIWGYFRG
jgi:hypothetical protein